MIGLSDHAVFAGQAFAIDKPFRWILFWEGRLEQKFQINREEISRRLLGAATRLFIDDSDPISVHTLACSAGEHTAELVRNKSKTTFTEVAAAVSGKTVKDIRKIRNHYWTRIKHAKDDKGAPFNIEIDMSDFSDSVNDHSLFVGWLDFSACGFPLPIEVQVFQVWYYEMYPEKINHGYISENGRTNMFPRLTEHHRKEQKRQLRMQIGAHRTDSMIASHPKTDPRPLML